MPSDGPLTPQRRDAIFALVALVLLVAPLWAPTLHLGQPTYRYKRARIVVGGDRGLDYADRPAPLFGRPISDEIGCSVAQDARVCAFERFLAENHTVPTSVHVSGPGVDYGSATVDRYRYVLLNGSTYRAVYVANQTVTDADGMYRLDLALEPVALDEVLRDVSLNATSQSGRLPSPVLEAATHGVGRSHRQVNVPRTPIQVANGTYYRVYAAGRTDSAPLGSAADFLLTYVAPVVGLLSLLVLLGRVEVTYVGPRR